jgi:hypothetical protein
VYGEKVWQLHELEHLPVYYLEYREDLKLPSFWNRPESFPLLAEVRMRPGALL